jgi:hypothetical protein
MSITRLGIPGCSATPPDPITPIMQAAERLEDEALGLPSDWWDGFFVGAAAGGCFAVVTAFAVIGAMLAR